MRKPAMHWGLYWTVGPVPPHKKLDPSHLRTMPRAQRNYLSVTVRVKQYSPAAFPPSWATKSISTKPSTASSHSA